MSLFLRASPNIVADIKKGMNSQLAKSGNGPRKLYYVTISKRALNETGNQDAHDIITRPDDEITTVIDISEYIEAKIRAIRAHSSQQDARWLADMFQQARESRWARSEFFHLAYPRKQGKESDIFA